MDLSKTLCHCHGVTERDVHHAVAQGANSLFDVMGCLGAGTGCGNCQADLRRVIAGARSAREAAVHSVGCSSTSRTTPISTSVGISLNTR